MEGRLSLDKASATEVTGGSGSAGGCRKVGAPSSVPCEWADCPADKGEGMGRASGRWGSQ